MRVQANRSATVINYDKQKTKSWFGSNGTTTGKQKKTKPKIEPRIKVIPGKHRVEFKKASELVD